LQKYAGQRFDLIVAYSTEALSFLLNEGKTLSPGSPCITMFAAVKQQIGPSERQVTHIPAELDPRGTLELGLALFPDTRKVLVVAGVSAVDQVAEAKARSDFAPWNGKLEFDYTSRRPVAELMKEIVQLPPHTLVIFTNVASDVTGKGFIPRDLVRILAGIANAPVLSLLSTQIDTGVLGGSMLNMQQVGVMIGHLMVALESDKPMAFELSSSFIQPTFNWTQIERWGVDPDRLPAQSAFINRPLTLWGQYQGQVITAMSVILVLSALTVALAIQNRRRKLAEILARETAAQLANERDRLEERVSERTAHLSEALDFNETMLLNTPVPMGIYAESGQCELANDAFAHLVGATVQQLRAQNFHDIAEWKNTSLFDDCVAALANHIPQQREAHMVTSFGKDVWFEYRILPRHLKGQQHLLLQFVDLTERKRIEDALHGLAYHDTLTQLPNRRLLLDRLTQALRLGQRENRYLAVLFIDLNKFKLVNDTYGHDVGDQMLIEVANRLKKVVRQSDTVARIGGDEYVVVLAGLSTDQELAAQHTETTVEKIRGALCEEYLLKTIHLHGSGSVGFKLILCGDMDPEQLLKEADSAMYGVKKGSAK
jgi:diguanylate cyclase (GGDEF)-like protein/PAS domain S-box-containing protein